MPRAIEQAWSTGERVWAPGASLSPGAVVPNSQAGWPETREIYSPTSLEAMSPRSRSAGPGSPQDSGRMLPGSS